MGNKKTALERYESSLSPKVEVPVSTGTTMASHEEWYAKIDQFISLKSQIDEIVGALNKEKK